MIALRTALRPPRLIAAAAALTLCLAGCSGGGQAKQDNQGEQGDQQQAASAPAEGGESPSGSAGESGAGGATGAASEGTGGSGGSPTTPSIDVDERFKDAPKTTSWASDESMKVDKKGYGTIPEKSLEFDLKDLFTNKFKMKVSTVDCTRKMSVYQWRGSTLCNVTADGKKYFGSVKLIDHKGDMIKYELKFPGLKKKKLKLD